MDNAVALVQAYLRLNGYFTVSEYPVVEELRRGGARTITDIDILGLRFAGAGRLLTRGATAVAGHRYEVDPILAMPVSRADMLIGEVKEGRAELNRGCRDPRVLEMVLTRFGCCPAEDAAKTVELLIRSGAAPLAHGHTARLVAFGVEQSPHKDNGYLIVSLGHVITFLQEHVREHWHILRHVQPKDAAFGFLTLLEKTMAGYRSVEPAGS